MRQTLLGIVAFLGICLAGTSAGAVDFEKILGEKVLGSPDAPVTIEEHSSFTCGHCGNFHREVLPEIKKEYIDTGKVRLIFRDFPLDQLALAVSMLPHCAGPERYYGFVDVLFRNQDTWYRAQDRAVALSKLVRLGGMSESEFQACLQNEEIGQALIERREADAKRLEIDSTPTFVVNGEKIVGAMPYEDFKNVIDKALEKAK